MFGKLWRLSTRDHNGGYEEVQSGHRHAGVEFGASVLCATTQEAGTIDHNPGQCEGRSRITVLKQVRARGQSRSTETKWSKSAGSLLVLDANPHFGFHHDWSVSASLTGCRPAPACRNPPPGRKIGTDYRLKLRQKLRRV